MLPQNQRLRSKPARQPSGESLRGECAVITVLSRALTPAVFISQEGDFVKRDSAVQFGKIEITLRGKKAGAPHVITRRINKRTNGSDWKLNGRDVSKKQVEEMVASLNIQIQNLCQFLPQDKVTAFSMMKPNELLLETERALGDSMLLEQHEQLIDMRKQIRDVESSATNNADKLERLKKQNAALERDVERNKQRDDILKQVELLTKKLPWLKYNEQKEIYVEAKKKTEEGKKLVTTRDKQLKEAMEPVAKLKRKLDAAKDTAKEGQRKINKMASSRDKVYQKVITCEEEAEQVVAALEDKKKQAATFQAKVDQIDEKIASLRDRLDNDPKLVVDLDAITEARRNVQQRSIDVREVNKQVRDVQDDLRRPKMIASQLQTQLKEESSARGKRLQALANSARGGGGHAILKLDAEVQRAKRDGRFKGNVWGPVACEVNMKNIAHSKLYCNYLEQHVPGWVWGAYIVETDEDRTHIRNTMKSIAGCASSVVRYAGDAHAPLTRANGPSKERCMELGVPCTLDQVFDAPAVIKHVLNDNAAIASAYCADDSKGKHYWEAVKDRRTPVDEVLEAGVKCLFTPEARVTIKTSSYNKSAVSKDIITIYAARIFTEVSNQQDTSRRRQELQKAMEVVSEMEGKLKGYEARRRELETSEAQARRHEDQLKKVNKDRASVEASIKRSEATRMQMESINIEQEEKKAKAKLAKVTVARADYVLRLTKLVSQEASEIAACDAAALDALELEGYVEAAKDATTRAQENKDKAEQLLATLRGEQEAEKKRLKEKQREAMEVCQLSDELREKFAALPDSSEECESEITENKRRADAVVLSNPDALAEYQRRCAEIKVLERKTRDSQATYDKAKTEMDEIKRTWLPTLRNLVAQISKKYMHNFGLIGCCGEVKLEEAGEDYENYQIAIYVKFRDNEKLVRLTSQRQSGGERSVSTMLYLLSLQALTSTPFRVVDEINQGMDPNNERKIHQLLCRAATQPGTPQCFVLTPKLLPDLEYNDAVTVMCIFNGPWIADVAKEYSNESFRKRVRAC